MLCITTVLYHKRRETPTKFDIFACTPQTVCRCGKTIPGKKTGPSYSWNREGVDGTVPKMRSQKA